MEIQETKIIQLADGVAVKKQELEPGLVAVLDEIPFHDELEFSDILPKDQEVRMKNPGIKYLHTQFKDTEIIMRVIVGSFMESLKFDPDKMMTAKQIKVWVRDFIREFPDYKLNDLVKFFSELRRGKFSRRHGKEGKLYGSVSGVKLFELLALYDEDRLDYIHNEMNRTFSDTDMPALEAAEGEDYQDGLKEIRALSESMKEDSRKRKEERFKNAPSAYEGPNKELAQEYWKLRAWYYSEVMDIGPNESRKYGAETHVFEDKIVPLNSWLDRTLKMYEWPEEKLHEAIRTKHEKWKAERS